MASTRDLTLARWASVKSMVSWSLNRLSPFEVADTGFNLSCSS